jgi:hypothetical protein
VSPFEALYGYLPPSIKEYVINYKVLVVKYYLATSDEVLCTLKYHLEQARNQMNQQVDKVRTDKEFMIAKWVFVWLQAYKQSSLKNYKKRKLEPNFYGPYQIQKSVGQFSYSLDISNKGKLHDVFHVSCLKKKLGPIVHIQIEFPLLDEEGRLILLLEGILEVRTKFLHYRIINDYIIKWKNLPEDEATWEDEEFISKHLYLPMLWGWRFSGKDGL